MTLYKRYMAEIRAEQEIERTVAKLEVSQSMMARWLAWAYRLSKLPPWAR